MLRLLPAKRRGLAITALSAVLLGGLLWTIYAVFHQMRLDYALIDAIKRNDTPSVLSLLAQGADANARDLPPDNRSFWQILSGTLRGGRSAIGFSPSALSVALNDYFDWEYDGDWGPPPKETRLISALLERGADVNARSSLNRTPLMLAMHPSVRREVAELLLAYHSDVSLKDEGGRTALNYAASNRQDLIPQLLARGAAINARGDAGRTPLMDVLLKTIQQMLKQAGAKE